ncbi:MAG: NPCBM/NEW2 domain-containing protein, partial [Kiritimatiellae bacterium]|nr:NPCBM/NEW2 domain-containing protein [Kiritimatiellia bacterium]
MKKLLCFLAAASFCSILSADTKVWLDETDLSMMTSGWLKPQANKSVNGNPLKAGRKKFDRGVGTHADSIMIFETNGNALSFEAE